LCNFGDHILEQNFDGYCVAAALMGEKKLAIAGKGASVECNVMVIIRAVKGKVKFVEAETLPVFCISFRFLQFADQSIVHFLFLLLFRTVTSLEESKQKDTWSTRVSSFTKLSSYR
jgi:hypothetical protein